MEEFKAYPVFEKAVQQANGWIKDLMYELNLDDSAKTFQALRATLHTLRDRLLPEEAVHLGAQLPMLLRGSYYDGWKLSAPPLKLRSKEELFTHLKGQYNAPLPVDAELLVRAVFKLLRHHVSPGEIKDIEATLPEKLRELWPREV